MEEDLNIVIVRLGPIASYPVASCLPTPHRNHAPRCKARTCTTSTYCANIRHVVPFSGYRRVGALLVPLGT